jgi:response regulator RpfG family c-di-GMP phosphodiesterase
MKDCQETLDEILRLSMEMNRIHDQDILLEKILFEARRMLNADAGSIYVKKGDSLVFSHVQNETLQQLLPQGRKLPYTVYEVKINPTSISGYVASTGTIVSIPDVYLISKDSPYHFDPFFDNLSHYRTQSMLTVPLMNNMREIIGVLQLINSKDKSGANVPFDTDGESLIQHFASVVSMVLERAGITRSMILRMISMAELRDPKETGTHVNRVASYSVELYEKWATRRNISESEMDHNKDILRMAAMLHDVGKVAISDLILKKSARFTPEEYGIIKTHTWLGARLFASASSELDRVAREVALSHHENWDGTGYPGDIDPITGQPLHPDNPSANSMKGEKIPLWGRIVSVADVYDALSTKRVYKEVWSEANVLEEIRNATGTKFDPEIVEIFLSDIDNIRSLKEKYPDSE